ncbi:hypothetical protein CLF_105112 [Clonorchis sinensis]|uniref:Uncharacterized protein n=1 Tax=Clonorchis sinensis TaxID=79923 RepID=G7YCZ5_CLOSI|nr:hypothetical protein CLF_105112 [Clonorchis sinensis]
MARELHLAADLNGDAELDPSEKSPSLQMLQTSTAVAQTPRRTVIHSNWLLPGLRSHGPATKGKLSVTLHPPDSPCQSPSHPDSAATELRIPSPIAAPLTTVTGLSIIRSMSVQ